jgi:redox-sensitive bicupin YhaK (pirin superfamily)
MDIVDGKSVSRVVQGQSVVEGDGFVLQRLIPSPELELLDPFVLLDHAGPVHFNAGQAPNIPAHPHAGFEIVTYIVHGGLKHRDSFGLEVEAGQGDLMWMTTGSGLIHEELAGTDLQSKGGTLEVLQLWINLPVELKEAKPNAGVVLGREVPQVEDPIAGISVRVLAGRALGQESKLGLYADLNYLLVRLAPGARFDFLVPEGHTAMALALSAGITVGVEPRPLPSGQLAVFGESGSLATLGAHEGDEDLHRMAILATAPPTKDPVVRHGPFVMHSIDGIKKVITDYQLGVMGQL